MNRSSWGDRHPAAQSAPIRSEGHLPVLPEPRLSNTKLKYINVYSNQNFRAMSRRKKPWKADAIRDREGLSPDRRSEPGVCLPDFRTKRTHSLTKTKRVNHWCESRVEVMSVMSGINCESRKRIQTAFSDSSNATTAQDGARIETLWDRESRTWDRCWFESPQRNNLMDCGSQYTQVREIKPTQPLGPLWNQVIML